MPTATPSLDDFRAEATARREATRTSLQMRQDTFIQRNPGVVEGLRECASWNDFSASLVEQFERKGDLSVNQLAAANRMLEKIAANKKAREASTESAATRSGEVDMSAIRELFATAQNNGLKKPKFYAGDVKISLAPVNGKNAGALYVTRDPDVYQGKIFGDAFNAARDCAPDTLEVLKAISKDPAEYARMTGKATGRCCCCGRELTDPESIANGIGPICAEKWGL